MRSLLTFVIAVLAIQLVPWQVLPQGKPGRDLSVVLREAKEAYDRGSLQRVEDLLNPLVERGKANEVAYLYLGMVSYDKGDLASAEASFEQAIAISPKYAMPYSEMAALYELQGKHADSELMARKAIELDARSARAYANLGMAQYSQGRKQEAYGSFLSAAKIDPNVITSCGVEMLTKYNDPRAALYYFDISLQAAPNHPLTLLDAAQAHLMLKEPDTAKKLLERGYEVTSVGQEPFGVIYSTYFRLLLDQGDYTPILKEALVKVGPDYPSGVLMQTLAYYKLGHTREFESSAGRYFQLLHQQPPQSLESWAQDYIKTRR